MKFQQLLEELIVELSGEDAYKKFYSNMDKNVFNQIIFADPKTITDASGNISKVGPYSKNLLTMYKKRYLKLEDLPRAKEYLEYVYQYNIRGMDKVRNLDDLYKLVQQYIIKSTNSLTDAIKALSPNEYKILYDGQLIKIFQPLTEKAACYIGVNTVWCTTWGPASLNDKFKGRVNQFNYYHDKGPLYIIISKQSPDEKYQFHLESKQFMDINDKKIDSKLLFKKYPELKNFFFPSFVKEVTPEQLKKELSQIFMLSKNDSMTLIEKTIGGTSENPLITAIIERNKKQLNSLIHDDNIIDEIAIYSGKINFPVSKLTFQLTEISYTLNSYIGDKQNSWETLYSQISDIDIDDDWVHELFENSFKSYYLTHKDELIDLNVYNYEGFKKYYFHDFYNDSKIIDSFKSNSVKNTEELYIEECDEEINQIENFIMFSESHHYPYSVTIELDIENFIIFVARKSIKEIPNINDFTVQYCIENDVPIEYDGIYNFTWNYATYESDESYRDDVDNYFQEFLDDA